MENESSRHARHVLLGWKTMVRGLRGRRPAPAEAAALVNEAAYWLYRLRGIRDGGLRVMRWGVIVSA